MKERKRRDGREMGRTHQREKTHTGTEKEPKKRNQDSVVGKKHAYAGPVRPVRLSQVRGKRMGWQRRTRSNMHGQLTEVMTNQPAVAIRLLFFSLVCETRGRLVAAIAIPPTYLLLCTYYNNDNNVHTCSIALILYPLPDL